MANETLGEAIKVGTGSPNKWRGRATVYAVNPPVPYPTIYGKQCEALHVIVSAVDLGGPIYEMGWRYEAMAFPCDPEGNTTEFGELGMSRSLESMPNDSEVLHDMGYQIIER